MSKTKHPTDAIDDPFLTHGKGGVPELPAQPDPDPPTERLLAAPRKPGRPRGSRTRKPETAIIYATKDRPECGGEIIAHLPSGTTPDDPPARILVNNGMGLFSIPETEEGETWVRRSAFEESRRLGALIKLEPATMRGIPWNESKPAPATPTAPTQPRQRQRKPRPAPAGPLPLEDERPIPDLLWEILDAHAGDLAVATVGHDAALIRYQASSILRVLTIAGI